jgi:hypothetical protein
MTFLTRCSAVRRFTVGKEIDRVGGVIFTKAENDKINTIEDLRDKYAHVFVLFLGLSLDFHTSKRCVIGLHEPARAMACVWSNKIAHCSIE